ncbi:MAG: methyltransferase domain-containing protein [Candidatus Limnocylindrales bacterium]
MRNRLFTTEVKAVESYRGITIHADTGVHEAAAQLVRGYVLSASRVLDVGAGAGAFSRRLADSGYQVTALDVDPEEWIADEIPFRVLDIDRGLQASVVEEYDAAVCLEVIEHLENPWQFMRETLHLVRPGGHLILSTPNITSFYSRALFLRRGLFHQFGPSDLEYGHISPLTWLQIETAAARAGWETLECRPAGYLPVLDFSVVSLSAVLMNALRAWSDLVSRGRKRGWCLLFVFRRPAAQPTGRQMLDSALA